MTKPDYPMFFKPVERPKLWGAERWLVSAHRSCPSEILNGPLKGKTLDETLPGFPVIIKEIRADSWLSVQVHPGEELCRIVGGEPKNELWRILSPGQVMAGFKPGIARGDVERELARGSIGETLELIDAGVPDIYEVPCGVVHSIGAGARVFEVQQSSDTTLRLYDWEREDADGARRQLHVEKALAAIDWNAPAARSVKAADVRNFRFSDETMRGCARMDTGNDFAVVYCASGELLVGSGCLKEGGCVLLPPGFTGEISSAGADVLTVRIADFRGRAADSAPEATGADTGAVEI